MLKKILREKRNAFIFVLTFSGIIGILSAIIVSPEFAVRYISSDNYISIDGIEKLQYFRLISLLDGIFLLLTAILLLKLPAKYLKEELAYLAFFFTIVVYLAIFGYNTLYLTHNFWDPDTMNFVDIARNIVTGRGIAQSTLGFNQTHFSVEDQIPMPLASQPPLYPLMIAVFSWFGLPYAKAGLIVSIVSYGLILLLTYRLSQKVYDRRTALLSVGILLLYDALHNISSSAFSEPISIVFLLMSFLLLIQIRHSATHHILIPAMAGLANGLAFTTRYALLPLLFLGIVFILFESRRKLRDLSVYIILFVIPAGLVITRNIFLTGTIMPDRNPSTVDLKSNVLQTFEVMTSEYSTILNPRVQSILLILSIFILILLLVMQRKVTITIQSVFIRKGRYLLSLWVFGYLSFLIFSRTRVHFDTIDSRLILPAGIIIIMLFSALIVKTTEIRFKYLLYLVLVIAVFTIEREIFVTIKTPAYNRDQIIANSERLSWVAQHTTERDLIIGNGTVDIPFYLNRPATISFQYYPENDILEYKKVMSYCIMHRKKYEYIYLIVQVPSYRKLKALTYNNIDSNNYETNIARVYGAFITDILFVNSHKYPGITFLDRLSSTYFYKIECQH